MSLLDFVLTPYERTQAARAMCYLESLRREQNERERRRAEILEAAEILAALEASPAGAE